MAINYVRDHRSGYKYELLRAEYFRRNRDISTMEMCQMMAGDHKRKLKDEQLE